MSGGVGPLARSPGARGGVIVRKRLNCLLGPADGLFLNCHRDGALGAGKSRVCAAGVTRECCAEQGRGRDPPDAVQDGQEARLESVLEHNSNCVLLYREKVSFPGCGELLTLLLCPPQVLRTLLRLRCRGRLPFLRRLGSRPTGNCWRTLFSGPSPLTTSSAPALPLMLSFPCCDPGASTRRSKLLLLMLSPALTPTEQQRSPSVGKLSTAPGRNKS